MSIYMLISNLDVSQKIQQLKNGMQTNVIGDFLIDFNTNIIISIYIDMTGTSKQQINNESLAIIKIQIMNHQKRNYQMNARTTKQTTTRTKRANKLTQPSLDKPQHFKQRGDHESMKQELDNYQHRLNKCQNNVDDSKVT